MRSSPRGELIYAVGVRRALPWGGAVTGGGDREGVAMLPVLVWGLVTQVCSSGENSRSRSLLRCVLSVCT